MRRYKYLEKMFEEEMKKVLVFMKGFTPKERIKLARMTALWISNGSVPPTVLSVLINEHLVKDNLALDFLLEVFVTWRQEKGLSSLMTALKKGNIEGRYEKISYSKIYCYTSFISIDFLFYSYFFLFLFFYFFLFLLLLFFFFQY